MIDEGAFVKLDDKTSADVGARLGCAAGAVISCWQKAAWREDREGGCLYWCAEHVSAKLLEALGHAREKNEKARKAIKYSLDRIRSDVDFFYVMNLTEAQARLCSAYAALSGLSLAEIEDAVNNPIFPKGRDVATIEKLQARIDELERGES